MGKKLTAVYCRTATADEIAIKAQERRILAFADEHGYGGEMAFYRDCGQSGAALDRPALNALTADIRAGKIGAVLVTDISRIARTLPLASEWLDLSDRYGVTLVTLADAETARENSISYQRAGDYLIPNITISDPQDAPPLGLYGGLHKQYLREHKPALYSRLLLSERLYPLCRSVDEAAAERLAAIGNSDRAREVILAELVYN
jgi:hypothetical protein